MDTQDLKIPLPPAGTVTAPLKTPDTAAGWKTIRIRKPLYDVLIMLQATKVLQGNDRPTMTDLITEMTSQAIPSIFPDEPADAGGDTDG